MAWYEIKHSCGHEDRVQIYGTDAHGERQRKIAWLEQQPCKECKRERALAKAAEWERENGVSPEMRGSEKQVAWARQIRAGILGSAEAWDSAAKVGRKVWDAVLGAYADKDAAWWIDHRDRDYDGILYANADAVNEAVKSVVEARG